MHHPYIQQMWDVMTSYHAQLRMDYEKEKMNGRKRETIFIKLMFDVDSVDFSCNESTITTTPNAMHLNKTTLMRNIT